MSGLTRGCATGSQQPPALRARGDSTGSSLTIGADHTTPDGYLITVRFCVTMASAAGVCGGPPAGKKPDNRKEV